MPPVISFRAMARVLALAAPGLLLASLSVAAIPPLGGRASAPAVPAGARADGAPEAGLQAPVGARPVAVGPLRMDHATALRVLGQRTGRDRREIAVRLRDADPLGARGLTDDDLEDLAPDLAAAVHALSLTIPAPATLPPGSPATLVLPGSGRQAPQ